jgi:TetR/AcrR family transcriptional regulator, tetracycline repressor protein
VPVRGEHLALPTLGHQRLLAPVTVPYTDLILPSKSVGDSPRARGRPPSLADQDVVDAALELTATVGFDNLSMRALARSLGVPTMTIYSYVPSKGALLDLVIGHILREIPIPGSEAGSWDQRLRTLLRDARRVLGNHPGVSTKLGDNGTKEGARLADAVLEILRDAGFPPEVAVMGFATLYTFMTGQIDLDFAADDALRQSRATLTDVTSSVRRSRDELFEFGFDVVIDGLRAKLPAT